MQYVAEHFTPEEAATLRPYFTNLDGPVFALVNLPEVVKGALFARYSRSPLSLRRLFLSEFVKARLQLRQLAVSPLDAFEPFAWLPLAASSPSGLPATASSPQPSAVPFCSP